MTSRNLQLILLLATCAAGAYGVHLCFEVIPALKILSMGGDFGYHFAASPWAARGAAIVFGLSALLAAVLLAQMLLREQQALLYAVPLVGLAALNVWLTSNWGMVEGMMETTVQEIAVVFAALALLASVLSVVNARRTRRSLPPQAAQPAAQR